MATRPTRRKLNPQRVHQCPTYKVAFERRDEALDAAELAMLRGQVLVGCHIVPFECPTCHRWHLTNRVVVQLGSHRRTTFQLTDEEGPQ
jgi:hypothetical protein